MRNGNGCEDPDGPLELGDGQFRYPTSIAVDRDGFVYVSDDDNSRIQKFTSDGQFVTKWGKKCHMSQGSGCEDPDGDGSLELGDGEFYGIVDLAVGDNGFVYALDYRNNRVQKSTLDGQFVDKWQGYGKGDGEFHYL